MTPSANVGTMVTMTDRNPTKGQITGHVGEIPQDQIRADRVANADQKTRPSIIVERALRALQEEN